MSVLAQGSHGEYYYIDTVSGPEGVGTGSSGARCLNGWNQEDTVVDSTHLSTKCVLSLPDPPNCETCCEKGKPCPVGNPVDTGSGAKLHSETDYADTSGRLSFKRRYASVSGGWQNATGQMQDPLNRAGC